MTQWPPAYMQGLGGAGYGMWDSPTPGLTLSGQVQPGEGGVDIGVPIGTPVYALASGPIVGAGYWQDNAHGVITQRVNVPGAGPQDLYYQHIQLDPSIAQCQGNCNQYVQRGQRIGTIGPFNEIEMGFNSYWGGPWGGTWHGPGNHPGPWIRDPRGWLQSLVTGSPTPFTGSVGGTGTGGLLGITPASFLPQAFLDWISNPARIAKMVAGVMLVAIALYLLITPEAEKKVGNFVKNNPEVLAA